MPLLRYQPVRKKVKVNHGSSLEDLNDYCLSKIIGYALTYSSIQDSNLPCDNRKTEKNLSLVSKRWYYLTQAQVSFCGVCRIDLDRIGDPGCRENKSSTVTSNISKISRIKEPSVLVPRNNNITCATVNRAVSSYGNNQLAAISNRSIPTNFNIDLFRLLLPRFRKYRRIQLVGTLTCDEFRKLIVGLGATQVEQLHLDITVKNDRTSAIDFAIIPKQLGHLERLILIWSYGRDREFTNALMWTVYLRACNLKTLEIYLKDEDGEQTNQISQNTIIANKSNETNAIERIANKYLDISNHLPHHFMSKLIFNRSQTTTNCNNSNQTKCDYTSLMKSVISSEKSLSYVDTNDKSLIEYLILSSDRICTKRTLKHVKFSSDISDTNLLGKLLTNGSLGTDHLSLVLNSLDQLDDIKIKLEEFHSNRHEFTSCHLSFHTKDQKFSDIEDKIKNLAYISKLAQVIVYVSCQQRVSIDCCHLMWSIGRSLQSSSTATDADQANCIFKILLQTNPSKLSSYSEITVPFGKRPLYKINQNREDLIRHREVIKSLRKDCYNSFVKSVRDNITP